MGNEPILTENLTESLTNDLTESSGDDWGAFGASIAELEAQEKAQAGEPVADTASNENDDVLVDGMLTVMFTLVEKVTSVSQGIDFEFPEKEKSEVIDVAKPVFAKYQTQISGLFGYVEELTLAVAVISLAMGATRNIKEAKAIKHAKEVKEVEDGKEAETANAA